MNVLVTGGCGYIGSHMVRVLGAEGHSAIVIDDLSSGHRETLPAGVPLYVANVRDRATVVAVMSEHRIDAVLHFAARIQVGESMTHPRLYFRENLGATIELLEAVLDAKIERFVLSSTAAVYGSPVRVPIDEDHPRVPINPYGETKLGIEGVLARYAAAYGLKWAALRYFNAAGGIPGTGLGERHEPETHLIPLVIDAALGKRPNITVFGIDYATPDGTCIRDYIHVEDLAVAHLRALEHLAVGGEGGAFNLGTGTGHSVLEVIKAVEQASGKTVPVVRGPRREGDPASLVASPERAHRLLGWRAKRSTLAEIVADAWACRAGAGLPD